MTSWRAVLLMLIIASQSIVQITRESGSAIIILEQFNCNSN